MSHTTNSILFTSGHAYIPGWVLIRALRDQDRERREREVEPRRVRKFLRQELLKKAGQVGWETPRVYQYNLADEPEREGEPADRPVVLVPSDSKDTQAEERPERLVVTMEAAPDTRVVLTKPLLSPIRSLPRTPGRDIQLPDFQEVSPRSQERQRAAETLEIQMRR